jgi:regulator of protease activity HflC (stomatin/prohibitin superfamily)
MTGNFEVKYLFLKKWNNIVILPISILLLLVAVIFGGALLYGIALLLLLGALAVNCLWFVPTGYVGYKTRFTKLVNKSYSDGINFLIPFIEEGNLLDTRVITKVESDTKKVLTRNNVTLECTLTFQIDPRYASQIFRFWGVNYYDTHVSKWVDACFDTFVSKLTYPQLQTQKDKIEEIASALVLQEVDKKCSEASKDMGSHEAFRAEYTADVKKAIDLDEDGTTEEIPMLELKTWQEFTDGVMFFKSFSLKINKVTFESEYEDARAKVAVAKANVAKAEHEKEAALILAEAKKQAKILDAEAEAEALRRLPQL